MPALNQVIIENYPLEIDSISFFKVRYEIKDRHLIIKGGVCGKLAVKLSNIRDFARELLEIAKVWEGVRT